MARESRTLPDGEFWMYLRKSRQDLDAEARGEGETLKKHKTALFKLAKMLNINVTRVFEEVVSGEFLIDRPEAMEMLRLMPIVKPKGILVMDIDRLGRGDQIDQGTIQRTFKQCNALIVTTQKTYDLNDEFDEEYTEFGMFMARKELKMINRRLQRGRMASVESGNYIGNKPPYGYRKITLADGSLTLEPNPDQAPIVKMIFEWYTNDDPNERIGTTLISKKLEKMGIPTQTGSQWIVPTVRDILQNQTYFGMIRWNRRKTVSDGTEKGKSRPRNVDFTLIEGKHEAIVSKEIFDKAQDIFKTKGQVRTPTGTTTNPLAGVIRCDMCSAAMSYRSYTRQPAHLMCSNQFCTNKSARFSYVEEKMIQALEDFLSNYKAKMLDTHKPVQKVSSSVDTKLLSLKAIDKELKDLEKQKGNLHDFLERGVYTIEVYLERSQTLTTRINEAMKLREEISKEIDTEKNRDKARKDIIPKVEKVINSYDKAKTPAEKNNLIKSILDYATYRKEKHQKLDDFTLVLHPKLPRL